MYLQYNIRYDKLRRASPCTNTFKTIYIGKCIRNLGLFKDGDVLKDRKGLESSDLDQGVKFPILIPMGHVLTRLIVSQCRDIVGNKIRYFDRVWHEGLLHNFECSGISAKLLALLRSFLTNRQQRVFLKGRNSGWFTVTLVVPQGSVLDPLFFLVYINDLFEGVHSDIKLFADDASIFSVAKDKDEATETQNRDLGRVRLWAWQ